MLTGRTVFNEALRTHTILPKPTGWPLLITPEATKLKPTGTLRSLDGPSGSGSGRKGNFAGRRSEPETSEILGDVPNGPLVCLVFQNVKGDMFVILISGCLDDDSR